MQHSSAQAACSNVPTLEPLPCRRKYSPANSPVLSVCSLSVSSMFVVCWQAARAIAAGRETIKKANQEENKEQSPTQDTAAEQQDSSSPAVVVSSSGGDGTANRRASRSAAAEHKSSSSHLIDMIPAASVPALALKNNPTHQPITAERALPTDTTAATGH